jgi:guanylate kinase
MRPLEKQGEPYYFTDPDTFHARIERGEFFEWAKQYNGQYYGVTKDEIERVANSGKLGIWKLDYQGVEHAKELFPGIQAILLTAPLHELEARIRRRDNPTNEYVAERMAYTKESLAHAGEYDLVVDNRDGMLDETVATISEFIESHLEVHSSI